VSVSSLANWVIGNELSVFASWSYAISSVFYPEKWWYSLRNCPPKLYTSTNRHFFASRLAWLRLFALFRATRKTDKSRNFRSFYVLKSLDAFPYDDGTMTPDQGLRKKDNRIGHITKPLFGCQSRFLHHRFDNCLDPPRPRGKQLPAHKVRKLHLAEPL